MRFVPAFIVLLLPALLLAQDPPLPTISRVVEVVRGADDSPVEGASVEAWKSGRKLHTQVTGADGTARFGGMAVKGVVYVARLEGHRCGWHEPGRWWWHMPPEDRDPDGDGVTRMTLRLVPGTKVEGLVTTKDGKPIDGAEITARESEHATDVWALRGAPLWTATTGKDGRFATTSHWPKPGKKDSRTISAIVTAGGPGWIHERTELWPATAGKVPPLSFSLHAAGRIQGVVTDHDGEPVRGAEVFAYPPDYHWFSPTRDRRDTRRTHPREMRVTTNERGEYFFREAFPGTGYRIFAERTTGDRRDLRTAVTDAVAVAAAGEKTVRQLRMRRLGRLIVRIDPREGGTSNNARIELTPPPDARPWVYKREKAGVVTVDEADPGTWTITADASGWLRKILTVDLIEGGTEERTIRLERGVPVEGVVVDDDGKPVAGAEVYVYSVDPDNPDAFREGYEGTRTGPDGHFRVAGLIPGPIAIGVNHDTLQEDGWCRVDAPAKDVRIVLHSEGSLRFRLVPPEGAKMPTAVRVTVTRLAGSLRGTQVQETLASRDGVFRIRKQMPGRVAVAVEANGYAPSIRHVTIRPGDGDGVVEFPLSTGLTLRGRVVDGAGEPVKGARVVAWGNESAAAWTKADGTFAIPHMIRGPVDLSVRAKGMAETLRTPTVTEGATPLTITVTPGGVVRGTYVYKDGSELTSLDIFPAAAADDNVSRWRVPAPGGKFKTRLPPGRYRITGHRKGERKGPVVFEVEEGGEVVLDIVFP